MANQGDSLYSVIINLVSGDSYAYYFNTNNSWTNYLNYRETVPEACALSDEIKNDPGWTTDRAFVVPGNDTIIGSVWGSCETIGGVSGISSFSRHEKFAVFPNPGSGLFKIYMKNADPNLSISLINLNGQVVMEENLISSGRETELNISSLPADIYILKVRGQDFIGVGRVVKVE